MRSTPAGKIVNLLSAFISVKMTERSEALPQVIYYFDFGAKLRYALLASRAQPLLEKSKKQLIGHFNRRDSVDQ